MKVGVKKDYKYYLTKFNTLARNSGEMVPKFTSRFCKLYHRIPEIVKPSEPIAMVAYAAAFEAHFALCLRERKSIDLDALFNDVEDMESNTKALGIQLKTRQDPSERRDFQDIRKGKETETSLTTQEALSMEEVTKLLRSMANDLTKVKQGQVAHAFIGPAARTLNQPLRNQPQFRRTPNMLQRQNRPEEPDLPHTSSAQANMMVPPCLYYGDYYE